MVPIEDELRLIRVPQRVYAVALRKGSTKLPWAPMGTKALNGKPSRGSPSAYTRRMPLQARMAE